MLPLAAAQTRPSNIGFENGQFTGWQCFAGVFRPNNDGINDQFHIEIGGGYNALRFTIYNRWGGLVFTAGSSRWDGHSNGKDLPVGIYYWVLESMEPNSGKKIWRRVSVTLVR